MFLLCLTKDGYFTILKLIITQTKREESVEEEKKENLGDAGGQKKLPPRPMPPRPPMMRKQIVVEGIPEEPKREVEVEQRPQQEEIKPVGQQNIEKTETKKEVEVNQPLQMTAKSNSTTKVDKEKAEKRSRQRASSKFNKKKFWLILCGVVAGIGLIVGLVFVIISLLPAKPLDTPTNLMISQYDDIVYVTCSEVSGASKYIFEIDGKKYDSKTPSLDLSRLVEPKQYSIRAYAIGDKNGSLSGASKSITYDLRKALQVPVIHFYESGSSVICWAEIQDATSYELFYNNSSKNIGNVLEFDLNTLGGGEYTVQVRAKTTKSGYVESACSNTLQFAVYEKLQGIAGRVLENGKIEISKVKNASSYVVTINDKTFGVARFDEEKYVVDLSVAGIAPSTVITYFKIEAVGENYFVSNSAELDTSVHQA